LRATLAELPAKPGQQHSILAADFSDPDKVAAAIKPAIDPARPFHILINNTGGPPSGSASEAEPQAYLAAFRMHVISNQVLLPAPMQTHRQPPPSPPPHRRKSTA